MSKEVSTTVSMEDIVSLCKRRGFIYQGSEIYGGLAGTWDYGPLGVALKRNVMDLWWKMFVDERDDMYGVDAAILMNQKVWQASGHVDTFTDPLVECSNCKGRFREDKLVDEANKPEKLQKLSEEVQKKIQKIDARLKPLDNDKYQDEKGVFHWEKLKEDDPEQYQLSMQSEKLHDLSDAIITADDGIIPLKIGDVKCPACGEIGKFGEARQFNMMFKTTIGPTEETETIAKKHYNLTANERTVERLVKEISAIDSLPSRVYLRPETAQGIFTNYKNIVDSFYPDVPFGIAQQGKAFRNEISPRDFVFRSREFEQMEIEYFVHPDKWEEAFGQWVKDIETFLEDLGLPKGKIKKDDVSVDDLAHYSKRTIDFEFEYPHGFDELLGLAYRTDFDLGNIQRESGKNMEYRPKDGSAPFVPHVIEPSFGVERAIMAVLLSAYTEDKVNGEKRTYLKLPAHLAPVKVAVSPLLKNKPELVEKAREVYAMLKREFGNVMWDDNGNIGKRYRRQDEIGTPYCVVIDFDTLEDGTITVRDRDTTEQTRVKTAELIAKIS